MDNGMTLIGGRRPAALAFCSLLLAAISSIISCGAAYATPELQEFSGNTRYETSALIVEEAFPDGVESGCAVIVSGTDNGWPDALSASSLAGAVEGPVLLTDSDSLPDATVEVIESLGIEEAFVIGGDSAVSSDVETELAEMGISTTRLAGDSRYETQAAIYDYGLELGYWGSMAFVASGSSYADALSASSVAYSQGIPIFLCDGDDGFCDEQVAALLGGDITEAVILGGDEAVSATIESYMGFVTRANSLEQTGTGISDVDRIWGGSRYSTSLEIAEWAVDSGYAGWDRVAFASGSSSTDALSGSSLQGIDGSVILLVDDEDCVTIDGLEEHASEVDTCVRIFGGTSAIAYDARVAICDAVGIDYIDEDDYEIMGESEVTVDQMVACYEATGHEYPSEELGEGGASTIEKFCKILYEEAETEGVKAEVVFAQAMLETGWLQFGGDVDISQFNFAGLGATGDGASGASFDSVREGLRAQVQHLKAYASTDDLVNDCVDPRFDLVTRGCAPTVQGLSMKWAMSDTYGDRIVALIEKVKGY